MKQIFGVLLFFVLSCSIVYAQNPWTWEVSPPDPTEIDTVSIKMAFYSDYNLSFESDHTVNGTDIGVNVDVFTGMLPISGWYYHTETIGCLAAGSYNCEIYVDYYVWNMGGWWDYVGSDSDSGSFNVQPSPAIPTLTQWGLIILVALIVLSTWVVLRRRKAVVS